MIRVGDLVFARGAPYAPPFDEKSVGYFACTHEPMFVWRAFKSAKSPSAFGCELVCLTKTGLYWFYIHEVYRHDDTGDSSVVL